jgi:LysR family transcriptional regulator for metE and metH
MTLEVRDLRLVTAVAEHGGLTRAGAVLHLSQSALSHQLADLERRLGAPVFQRDGRRMVLTPAGERLRDAAIPLLDAFRRAEEDARSVASQRREVLRLSTECYTCYHWLPGVLRDFHALHPTVEPRIVAEVTRRPIPALLRGEIDIAIVSKRVRDRRIWFLPLFRDELVAVVAPEHHWARRRVVGGADFATEHLIRHTVPIAESSIWQEMLIPARVAPRMESEVQLTEAILEMVRAGLGVTVLARWAVAPHVRSGALVAIPLGKRRMRRQWTAAVRRQKHLPPHVDEFVRLARDAFPVVDGAASARRRAADVSRVRAPVVRRASAP